MQSNLFFPSILQISFVYGLSRSWVIYKQNENNNSHELLIIQSTLNALIVLMEHYKHFVEVVELILLIYLFAGQYILQSH